LYSIKSVPDTAPPKELKEPIRALLGSTCVQLVDAKGGLMVELWFRKEVPVKATEAQIKNGVTYKEVAPSTVLGAMRVPKTVFDYPQAEDPRGRVHAAAGGAAPGRRPHGTAPYNDFCLACPAGEDTKPDLLEAKKLHELSGTATESHPAAFHAVDADGGDGRGEAGEQGHRALGAADRARRQGGRQEGDAAAGVDAGRHVGERVTFR